MRVAFWESVSEAVTKSFEIQKEISGKSYYASLTLRLSPILRDEGVREEEYKEVKSVRDAEVESIDVAEL